MQIVTFICLATASSANQEEREAKQFWPLTPQSLPLTYHQTGGGFGRPRPSIIPQSQYQYPIQYPVGFGFGGVRLRSKVIGTLKSKTVTPGVKKFKLHQQKNKPATTTYQSNNFETVFWFLDKVSLSSTLFRNKKFALNLML